MSHERTEAGLIFDAALVANMKTDQFKKSLSLVFIMFMVLNLRQLGPFTFCYAFGMDSTLLSSMRSARTRHSSQKYSTILSRRRNNVQRRSPILPNVAKWFPDHFGTRICSSSTDTETTEEELSDVKTTESEWNIPGLKKEVGRLILRCHKKVGKANERLRKAKEQVEALLNDETTSLETLDACPNLEQLEKEVGELRGRLTGLNELEGSLSSFNKKTMVLPDNIAKLALALDVNDSPPVRPTRGPKKPKGPRTMSPRKPYRRYYSRDSTEIRVGKTAVDNDDVSTSQEHRNDWWMHASGCPGSHVIIRTGDRLPHDEVVQDAAALAARHSKCSGKVIKVSLTRCRDIKKPPGAKPGLVQITGSVQTVSVNMKAAEERLQRLDETELIN